jgi:hypothetical protein
MLIHQILINVEKSVPKKLPKFSNLCIDKIKTLYTNCEYKLYSSGDIEEIIKNNFDIKVFRAYNSLKPYCYQSDLARYCLLYLFGGLYVDLNIYFLNAIKIDPELDFIAFRDLSFLSTNYLAIQTGLLYSKPKSTISEKCIEIIVEHCNKKYYGYHPIDVTGPTVLGKAFMMSNNFIAQTIGDVLDIDISTLDKNIVDEIKSYGYDDMIYSYVEDSTGKIIAIRKSSRPGDIETLGFKGTNNYVDMWNQRNVYSKFFNYS